MDHSNLVPLSLKRPGMDYISLPLHQLQPKQNLVKKTNLDLSKITWDPRIFSYKIHKSSPMTQNSRPASSRFGPCYETFGQFQVQQQLVNDLVELFRHSNRPSFSQHLRNPEGPSNLCPEGSPQQVSHQSSPMTPLKRALVRVEWPWPNPENKICTATNESYGVVVTNLCTPKLIFWIIKKTLRVKVHPSIRLEKSPQKVGHPVPSRNPIPHSPVTKPVSCDVPRRTLPGQQPWVRSRLNSTNWTR